MERIGNEVERELAKSGSSESAPLGSLVAMWAGTVGDTVARNAWPARVGRDGTLHVNTSSATWAFELTQLAGEIEERLRTALGEKAPARLRFAVGPVPEPDAAPVGPEAFAVTVEATPEIVETADDVASAIADPELRELVARAARASLSRPSSDRRF